MFFPFYIARRYFLSRKFGNAINIITLVAVFGIGFCTAALILVLSVFNGLTNFIEDLFSAIDPDLKVVAARGQYFEEPENLLYQISEMPDIEGITRTVEGKIVMEYVDNQAYGILKGVEGSFTTVNRLDTCLYEGSYDLTKHQGVSQAIMGSVIASRLKANILNKVQPIRVYYIPQESNLRNPRTAIQTDFIFPSGFFNVQLEYDEKYVVSDFHYVQELMDLEGKVSAFEIKLKDIRDASQVKKELEEFLGPDYKVLTWYEQHQTLYRVMKNEKYISFLILVLMLAITAINIVGSLSMIVLEKSRDIAVLKAMGATDRQIQIIFMIAGVLVGTIGGLFGLYQALRAGVLQMTTGIIELQGGETFRVKAFPIEMQLNDFLLVFATVFLLSVIASIYPARQAAKVEVVEGLRK